MNCPGPGLHFTTVMSPTWDKALFASFDGYALPINNDGEATLENGEVLVEVMGVRR